MKRRGALAFIPELRKKDANVNENVTKQWIITEYNSFTKAE